MEKLIELVEKAQPFFNRLASNKYLASIRDGFVAAMPIIIFSSIFLLVANIPNIVGFYWPEDIQALLMKPYNYSMGIFALVVAATTAKNFAEHQNRDLPANNQINFVSTMIAAIVGFLFLSSDAISLTVADGTVVAGFDSAYLGSTGLITAFIAAFVTGAIYKFCVGRNITIKLPEQVPPNISQTFKDLIPFGLSITFFWLFDMAFRGGFGHCFAQGVLAFFQPLFSASDGYVGLAIIYAAMSLFWFAGVHGPSIVEPVISAVAITGMTNNLALVQAGEQATNVLTQGTQYFVATLGGTGATLAICYMFAFLAKSRGMRAVGKAAVVPTTFGVNEPILFGAPLVLNPVFFVPFVLAPVLNVWLFKAFVDILGMNSFIYTLPWTTPGPLGIVLGCGLAPLAFVFALVVLAVDFAIYYPFFKVYDRQKCAEEAAQEAEAEVVTAAPAPAPAAETPAAEALATGKLADGKSDLGRLDGKKVLVLCAGGGTSGLLANALAKAAGERDIDLETAAGSYGAHTAIMPDFDLVVLAPQVASNAANLKADTDRLGIKSVACAGKQYIDLTRNGEQSLESVHDILFS